MSKTVSNSANLSPWKPGQSGNPAGRPKGTVSLRTILRAQLRDIDGDDHRTTAERLVAATLKDALAGDPVARKLVWSVINETDSSDNMWQAGIDQQADDAYREERMIAAIEAAEKGHRYTPGGDVYLWFAQEHFDKEAAALKESDADG